MIRRSTSIYILSCTSQELQVSSPQRKGTSASSKRKLFQDNVFSHTHVSMLSLSQGQPWPISKASPRSCFLFSWPTYANNNNSEQSTLQGQRAPVKPKVSAPSRQTMVTCLHKANKGQRHWAESVSPQQYWLAPHGQPRSMSLCVAKFTVTQQERLFPGQPRPTAPEGLRKSAGRSCLRQASQQGQPRPATLDNVHNAVTGLFHPCAVIRSPQIDCHSIVKAIDLPK